MQPSDADRPTFIDLAVKAGLVPADTPARDATTIIQAGLATEEALLALARDHAEAGAACPVCRGPLVTLRRNPALQLACDRCGLDVALDITLSSGRALPADAPAEVRDAASDPKHHFGPYILVREIGRGGFGSVYRAWHRPLNRFVAVKFMTSDDPRDAARFQREAQTSARLSHPHIVPIYEVGQLQGRHYIAMEFIDGRNLTHHRLAPRAAVDVIRDAADAVHYAHTLGVIHRDIKPQNLMLDAKRNVRVMDFGIARPVGTGATLTVTGTVVGTPAYMAPERAEGKPGDARADVYALGATLYEILTGRAPFEAATPLDTLQLVLSRDPDPPRRLNAGVPREVETIVLKAMEKDPARRYATARELADDLRRWLDGEPIGATRASITYRLRKSIARQPVIWSLAALLALAVVLGVRALVVSRANLQRALTEEQRRRTAEESMSAQLRLQELLERTAGTLRDLDSRLARRASDGELARIHAQLDALVATLAGAAKEHPGEGALWYLRAEANRLRHRDDEAIADYTRALDAPDTDWSRRMSIKGRAALGRARGRMHQLQELMIVPVVDDPAPYRREMLRLTPDLEADLARAGRDDMPEELRKLPPLWTALARSDHSTVERGTSEEIAAGGRNEEFHLLRALGTAGDDTLRSLTASLDRYHAQPLTWTIRGLEHLRLKQFDRAADDLSEALRYRPRLAAALYNRAAARHWLGDLRGSVADNTLLLEIDPGHVGATLNRANAHVALREYAAARADYDRALALDPALYHGYVNRATLRRMTGDVDGARADLDAAMGLELKGASTLAMRAKLRVDSGDLRGALGDLTKALAITGPAPFLLASRGSVHARLGEAPQAMDDFDRALQADPLYAAAYFSRGMLRTTQRDRDGAIADLKRFLELSPQDPQAPRAREILQELQRE